MSEYRMIDLEEEKNELGRIEISPEVIEVISGLAASEVDGVYSLRGNFAADVAERLGKKNHGKGVKVELLEDGVKIDISLLLNYGVSVPEVAREVQTNIQQALQTMTSIAIQSINVHILGIQLEIQDEVEQV
ncbi:Asp23/Gls24 family envelope stress response protein [Salibacterium aidingense]|uniref:Asp23/Gls24 family envelope stress response protein n=1 Tax=Salibacterium aidingense TaxID=384933 RepID=UPI0003FEC47B|nr:Asp23/Gls24 family envelope stress response protein [Salibacterium aidingense]